MALEMHDEISIANQHAIMILTYKNRACAQNTKYAHKCPCAQFPHYVLITVSSTDKISKVSWKVFMNELIDSYNALFSLWQLPCTHRCIAGERTTLHWLAPQLFQ